MDIERIARICYEATRAVAVSAGKSVPVWSKAIAFEKNWIRGFVACHLRNPETLLEDRHILWIEKLKSEKWTHGKELDYTKRTQPLIVPFAKLPADEKFKRQLIEAVVIGCTEE